MRPRDRESHARGSPASRDWGGPTPYAEIASPAERDPASPAGGSRTVTVPSGGARGNGSPSGARRVVWRPRGAVVSTWALEAFTAAPPSVPRWRHSCGDAPAPTRAALSARFDYDDFRVAGVVMTVANQIAPGGRAGQGVAARAATDDAFRERVDDAGAPRPGAKELRAAVLRRLSPYAGGPDRPGRRSIVGWTSFVDGSVARRSSHANPRARRPIPTAIAADEREYELDLLGASRNGSTTWRSASSAMRTTRGSRRARAATAGPTTRANRTPRT